MPKIGLLQRTVVLLATVVVAATSAASVVATSLCRLQACQCQDIVDGYSNVSCRFNDRQVVSVAAGALPKGVLEVILNGGAEVSIQAQAFSTTKGLQKFEVRGAKNVHVYPGAFKDLHTLHAVIIFQECTSLILDEQAMGGVLGPLSVAILDCADAVIKGHAFSWMLALNITQARLELFPHAFSFESPRPKAGHHGRSTNVILRDVTTHELPGFTFPTSAAKVRFERVSVKVIRADAFRANTLASVSWVNSTIQILEPGAFHEATHIHDLSLDRCLVKQWYSSALLSAVNNLAITQCRIGEIGSGGINATVADIVLDNNILERLHSKAFDLRCVSRLVARNNALRALLGPRVIFLTPCSNDSPSTATFEGNEVGRKSHATALEFLHVASKMTANHNRFHQCRCHMAEWLGELVDDQVKGRILYETSLCSVDNLLSSCFKVPKGWLPISNFTETVCTSTKIIDCDLLSGDGKLNINLERDPELYTEETSDHIPDSALLGLILVVVVTSILVVILFFSIIWLHRKGYFQSAGVWLASRLRAASNVSGSTSATLEYSAIHQVNSVPPIGSNDNSMALDFDDEAPPPFEEILPTEDKWTQTLPEELTQELIESLRERLEDPENFSDAVNMIEQLYSLIKIEESCGDLADRDAHLYDVIGGARGPAGCIPRRRPPQMVDVGTRVPSPDKLEAVLSFDESTRYRTSPPLVCEYAEPHDIQPHEYTELPSASERLQRRPESCLRELNDSLLRDASAPTLPLARRPLPAQPPL